MPDEQANSSDESANSNETSAARKTTNDLAARTIIDNSTSPPPTAAEPPIEETLLQSQQETGGESVSSTSSTDPNQPLTGQFGRYQIIDELGRGAMGTVYRAHDSQLDREVALKVPQFTGGDQAEQIDRFYREARAMATVRHPGLCPVYDVGEIDGAHYLTMAYIKGRPLSDLVKPGKPLPGPQVAALIRKLALALNEAHKNGIIHRDLKPANIMIEKENQPIIMDFGLAQRRTQNEVRLTQTGSILGTPSYMSPEQVDGDHDRIGPKTDIYSLGVICYQMLTGKLPFSGETFGTLIVQIMTTQPPPLNKFEGVNVDARLETICLKAMTKQPGDRQASADELANELREYINHPQPDSADTQPSHNQTDTKSSPAQAGSVTDQLAADLFANMEEDLPPTVLALQEQTTASHHAQAKSRNGRSHWIWIGGALAAAMLLLAAIVFFMQNNEGPDSITDSGQRIRNEPSPNNTNAPTVLSPGSTNSTRAAVEWVCSMGGSVAVAVGKRLTRVTNPDDLPATSFRVTAVDLYRSGKARSHEVHDGDLARLVGLKDIVDLHLRSTNVTDSGLRHLQELKSLKVLSLMSTNITDAGLAHFQETQTLTRITLGDTQITDTGIRELSGLRSAQFIDLRGTKATKAGVEALQAALPECIIYSDFKPIPPTAKSSPTNQEPHNYALQFDGEDDYVELPTLDYSNIQELTVEVYVTPLADHQQERGKIFQSRMASLDYRAGTHYFATISSEYLANGSWKPGTRVHIAATVKPGQFSLFINGEMVKQSRGVESVALFPESVKTLIGDGGVEARQFFNGIVDELRISRTVRYEQDFQPQRRFKPDKETLRLYHFDEARGDILEDYSGNGHHGKIHGATWIPVIDHERDREIIEWLLSRGASVSVYGSKGRIIVASTKDIPTDGFRIQKIILTQIDDFTESDVLKLAELSFVECLILQDVEISHQGIEALSHLPALLELTLNHTGTTDVDLETIANNTQLKKLAIIRCEVGDPGLDSIATLQLRSLRQEQTNITDAGLSALRKMTSLSEINLNNTGITDEGLKVLHDLKSLRSVSVEITDVTQAGVEALQKALPNCAIRSDFNPAQPQTSDTDRTAAEWVLSLGGTVTVAVKGIESKLARTAELPAALFQLVAVDLHNHGNAQSSDVTDDDLARLKGLTNLTSLKLYTAPVSNAGLQHLKELKSLKMLILGATKVSDDGLPLLAELTNLTHLDLSENYNRISDLALVRLEPLTKITFLGLGRTGITDAGISHLRSIKKLTSLGLPHTRITDAGLQQLESIQQLEELNVLSCKQITTTGVEQFRKALPKCRIRWKPEGMAPSGGVYENPLRFKLLGDGNCRGPSWLSQVRCVRAKRRRTVSLITIKLVTALAARM